MTTAAGVPPVELMQFDKNDTAHFPDPGGVFGADWISDVGAGRIAPMFITEFTLQYKKLLPTTVNMRCESAVRRVAHERGGARHFVANSIKHHALDAGHRRINPAIVLWADDNPFGKIRVYVHNASVTLRRDRRTQPTPVPGVGAGGIRVRSTIDFELYAEAGQTKSGRSPS